MKTFKQFLEESESSAKSAWNALPGDKPKKLSLTQAFYKADKDPGIRDYLSPTFNRGFMTLDKATYSGRMNFKRNPVKPTY